MLPELLTFLILCTAPPAPVAAPAAAPGDGIALGREFTAEADRRLDVPEAEQRAYANLLARYLSETEITRWQYVVLVDRSPFVQAAMIYWVSPDRQFGFAGAAPVSTGKPGRFDHFVTPLGVFPHEIANPDFRAEGTRNENGVRGYGKRGMRVFDFGWQRSTKGWGNGGGGTIRLQMHATDPDLLEPRVGSAQSKGCIRIPASLNVFLDHHAILDADYDDSLATGGTFWVLPKDRQPTTWDGRYLVIVDSDRTARPAWAALRGKR